MNWINELEEIVAKSNPIIRYNVHDYDTRAYIRRATYNDWKQISYNILVLGIPGYFVDQETQKLCYLVY